MIYFLFEKMAFDTEQKQLNNQVQELTASFSKMTEQNDPAVIMRAHIPENGMIGSPVILELGRERRQLF